MENITKTIDKLLITLSERENITLDGEGHWKKVPAWRVLMSNLLGTDETANRKNAEALVQELDRVESTPIHFTPGEVDVRFRIWIHLVEHFQPLISGDLFWELRQRFVGLLYRLEGHNKGKDPAAIDEALFLKVKTQAMDWKKRHPAVSAALLTPQEIKNLKIIAQYPEFVQVILNAETIREDLFLWILRDGNDAVAFIQFPATVKKIIHSQLSSRIGRFGGTSLKIQKSVGEFPQKILTLPFEGIDQSILDPQAVIHFRGEYKLTIDEIFEIFSKKEVAVGNLEFMQNGIINWNIHHLAFFHAGENRYVKVDVEDREWWKQLPHFEVLTRRQLMKRYQIELQPSAWVASSTATRNTQSLDFMNTHAFLEMAIPLGDGTYAIYDFGKLSFEYPANMLEKVMMLTRTVYATVAFPDENVYYSHRQHGFHPFALNEKQGRALMELLAQDIISSRKANFVYQIESENCAKWVDQKLITVLGRENVPDFFRMQLLDTEPEGPVAHIFNWIKQLPEKWHVAVLAHLHLPLGAHRKIWIHHEGEKISRSLSTHEFFSTGEIYLPALLIHKAALLAKQIVSCSSAVRERILKSINCALIALVPRLHPFTWLGLVAYDLMSCLLKLKMALGPPLRSYLRISLRFSYARLLISQK